MPTPVPGWKRVPRWRTMISPPVTTSPAKTFTPSRCALESRPLRDDPRPFLCAIGDLRDADAGELLPVAVGLLVALLGLVLEDSDLLAALVGDDLGGDTDLPEPVGVEDRCGGAEQHRRELDSGAGVLAQPLDEQGLPLLDAVLLSAGLDDRVGHGC